MAYHAMVGHSPSHTARRDLHASAPGMAWGEPTCPRAWCTSGPPTQGSAPQFVKRFTNLSGVESRTLICYFAFSARRPSDLPRAAVGANENEKATSRFHTSSLLAHHHGAHVRMQNARHKSASCSHMGSHGSCSIRAKRGNSAAGVEGGASCLHRACNANGQRTQRAQWRQGRTHTADVAVRATAVLRGRNRLAVCASRAQQQGRHFVRAQLATARECLRAREGGLVWSWRLQPL